jgi:hypothetical protein
MGLTPRPNIAGAAINHEPDPVSVGAVTEPPPAAAANSADEPADAIIAGSLANDAERDRQLAIVAAEMANLIAERDALAASLAAARANTETLTSRLDAQSRQLADLAVVVAERERQARELVAQRDAALIDMQAARAQSADATASVDDCVNSMIQASINGGLILAADSAHWRARLAASPAAVNELIQPDRFLKTASIVDAARISAANAALGGVSAAERFSQLVREHQARTHTDWPTAWNHCKSAHNDIYRLMPNGGKA